MLEKHNIFLIGPMGAGKSTIGRQLAQQLCMVFFDSDQEIEKRTGVNISWVFDVEGEIGFRDREEKIVDELTRRRGIVLATGGGSVVSSITRNNLANRGLVVYLETTVEKQLVRTQRDRKRPLLKTKSLNIGAARLEILENLAMRRNPLYEEIADVKISTDSQNIRVVVNKIVAFYEQNVVESV